LGTTNPHAVTVTGTRTDDTSRWVRVTLALRDPADGLGVLSHSANFLGAIEPLDALSETYALENWESGFLSGAFFAGRKGRVLPPYLVLSELVGRLASGDMEGIAHAAAVGVGRLLGVDPALIPTPEWQVLVAAPGAVVGA
jgi:hypothetical protein